MEKEKDAIPNQKESMKISQSLFEKLWQKK
jgi:hypothetical protein